MSGSASRKPPKKTVPSGQTVMVSRRKEQQQEEGLEDPAEAVDESGLDCFRATGPPSTLPGSA